MSNIKKRRYVASKAPRRGRPPKCDEGLLRKAEALYQNGHGKPLTEIALLLGVCYSHLSRVLSARRRAESYRPIPARAKKGSK